MPTCWQSWRKQNQIFWKCLSPHTPQQYHLNSTFKQQITIRNLFSRLECSNSIFKHTKTKKIKNKEKKKYRKKYFNFFCWLFRQNFFENKKKFKKNIQNLNVFSDVGVSMHGMCMFDLTHLRHCQDSKVTHLKCRCIWRLQKIKKQMSAIIHNCTWCPLVGNHEENKIKYFKKV
jgi:hypothetical protein